MLENFVNRDNELDYINTLLGNLVVGNESRTRVVEYYGIAGIGKSTLLNKICEICENLGLIHIYIDISENNAENDQSKLLGVLIEILKGLNIDYAEHSALNSEIFNYRMAIEKEKNWNATINLAVQKLITSLLSDIKGRDFVLLIDSIDKLAPETLTILERDFFVQSVSNNPIMILLAGCKKINWGNYNLKRILEIRKLEPLSKESTVEQLDALGCQNYKDEIYDITNGHPLSTIIAKNLLDEIELATDRQAGREEFGDYECRLIQAVEDEVIKNKVMESVNPELFPIIRTLSIPRIFDKKLVGEILSADMPSLRWDYQEADQLIETLKDLGVVEWSKHGYALKMDATVRNILSLYLRFCNQEKYLQITKALISFYENRIISNFDPTDVVEALYHLADLFRIEEKRGDVEIASGQLHKMQYWLEPLLSRLDQEKGNVLSILDSLKNLISNDKELLFRIGYKEEVDILTELIEKYIQQAQTNKRIFITIEGHSGIDQYGIKFEIEGDGVPLPTMVKDVNPARKREILSYAEKATTEDDLKQIGNLIFTQYLPYPFQDKLKRITDPLTILVNEPEIPWELMHDGMDFVFLKVPIGRRILTLEETKKTFSKRNKPLRFLIVGASKHQEKIAEKLNLHNSASTPLSEVIDEVQTIASQLESNPSINFNRQDDLLIDDHATGGEFIKRLATGGYDVIHFAGHAYDDREDSRHSGLVLFDEIISGANLADTIMGKPLVFLNACKTAASKSHEHFGTFMGRTTIGLGHSLTLGGALACVGNLWSISDFLATEFAKVFYMNLLKPENSVGEAMRQARLELRERGYSLALAWGSYVLYGDPSVKLF
jgi:hypothetical protein